MIDIRITTQGVDEAIKNLRSIRRQWEGQSRMYSDIGRTVEISIEQNSQAGGRDPNWPPRVYDYPHPILDKTGTMKDTAEMSTRSWLHSGTEHVLNILAPFYGKFHQYGTRKLPVRKFVKLLAQEVQAIRQRIVKSITDKIG